LFAVALELALCFYRFLWGIITDSIDGIPDLIYPFNIDNESGKALFKVLGKIGYVRVDLALTNSEHHVATCRACILGCSFK